MTGALPRVGVRRTQTLGHLVVDRRPDWWMWAVAGAGGLVITAQVVLGRLASAGTAGHVHHAGGAGPGAVAAHAVGWAAMVAAMLPLIAVNVRYAAMRSPSRSRGAVTGDVVAGWAVVWAGAAVALGLGTALVAGTVGGPAAIGLVTVGAAGWQLTGVKRRSLARCHRLLAPPLDRERSHRTCRRFGVVLGRDCVLSCWPLMALMAVAGHNPLVVGSTLGVAWYERRRRPHHDPATTGTALTIAAVGATTLAVGFLG